VRPRCVRWRAAVVLGLAGLALVSQSTLASGSVLGLSGARRTGTGRAIDTRYFEPGACVEFAPTAGDRHLTVFLDAGHGGLDPGAVGQTESGQTVSEADETLPVELDTMALLRANGFDVTVSRTGASTVALLQPGDVSGGVFTVQGEHRDLVAREVCANMAKADVLIGIYFDAGASPLNAGCLTGYDAARSFAAENLGLATLVQGDVLAAMNARGWAIPDQGVVSDTALGGPPLSQAGAEYGHLVLLGPADPGYVSTPSQMPGALVEPLYITDPFEASLAAGALGQQVIANGLATAVEGYFGAAGPGDGSPRSPSPPSSSAL
jgi:N-acetylmuramoyl-L-alanine amidase